MKALKSASAQLAQLVNRLITTLEGKGILRSAAEAFTLSGKHLGQDELNAEFLRTFRVVNFHGAEYLQRLEFLRKPSQKEHIIQLRVPSFSQRHRYLQCDVDVYGYRGEDPRVYYLSPWEFWSYW